MYKRWLDSEHNQNSILYHIDKLRRDTYAETIDQIPDDELRQIVKQ